MDGQENPLNLETVSYRVKYKETLKSQKDSAVLEPEVFMKCGPGKIKMKWSIKMGGLMPQMGGSAQGAAPSANMLIIMNTAPNGDVLGIEKALNYTPTGGPLGTICMDMTKMLSEKSNPDIHMITNNRQMLKDAKIEPMGTKSMVGVVANKFKITEGGKDRIICYHPKYAIMLEAQMENMEITATELHIGDIPDSEFEVPGGQHTEFDLDKLAGMFAAQKPGSQGDMPSIGGLFEGMAASKGGASSAGPKAGRTACQKCGAKNAPGIKFCGGCGNKLG